MKPSKKYYCPRTDGVIRLPSFIAQQMVSNFVEIEGSFMTTTYNNHIRHVLDADLFDVNTELDKLMDEEFLDEDTPEIVSSSQEDL